MAKPRSGKGGKKKEKRVVPHGVAHIQATFNNTLISIADPEGNVIGTSGFDSRFEQVAINVILPGQCPPNTTDVRCQGLRLTNDLRALFTFATSVPQATSIYSGPAEGAVVSGPVSFWVNGGPHPPLGRKPTCPKASTTTGVFNVKSNRFSTL